MLVPVDSGEVDSIDVPGVVGVGEVTGVQVGMRQSRDNVCWDRNLVREEFTRFVNVINQGEKDCTKLICS